MAGHEAEVAVVGRHYAVKIQFAGDECGVNVEKVTAFEALIECADFRPDQLVQLVCEHVALATEPIVLDGEGYTYHRENTEMLLAVDFHFQVDLARAHIGRLNAEDEGSSA